MTFRFFKTVVHKCDSYIYHGITKIMAIKKIYNNNP